MILKLTRKAKMTFVQINWTLGAFALLAGAALAITTPNEKILSISIYLGLLMLFAGIINIVVYIQNRNPLMGAHWIIADGLTTLFLSLFPIFNAITFPNLIPFFFGAWELFSGIVKIVECIELQDYKLKGWQWFAAIGSIELFSGISSMIKPVDDLIGIHVVIAIIMLIQSLGFIFKIFVYRHQIHIISEKKNEKR